MNLVANLLNTHAQKLTDSDKHMIMDIGIAHVFVEGRLSKDYFSLVGVVDARVGNLIGCRGTLTINPHQFKMQGDAYLCGVKIYHGLISISDGSFKFEWSLSAGIVGGGISITYKSIKAGEKVIRWSLNGRGRVWVKLPWPYGKKSVSLSGTIDSRGCIKVTFWKLYIKINIPKFRIKWGWR